MRPALATTLAVLCLIVIAPAAGRASPVAMLVSGEIMRVDSGGGTASLLAGSGDWVSLAYSGPDRLLAARQAEQSCDVVDPSSGQTVAVGVDIVAQTDRYQGACQLTSDPAGGLYLEADNGTLGSATTFRLDIAASSVPWSFYGYGASAAADGSLVTIQHRYFAKGGSYEQPWIRTPAGASRALVRVRSARRGLQYQSIAISRDGRQVAGIRWAGSRRPRTSLVLMSASGRNARVLWRRPSTRPLTTVEWLPDGSGLLVGVSDSRQADSYAIYRVSADGRSRVRLATGVSAFAVGG